MPKIFFLLLLFTFALLISILAVGRLPPAKKPERAGLQDVDWFKHGEIFTHPRWIYKGYGKLIPTARNLVHFVTVERLNRAEDLRDVPSALQRMYRRLLVDPEARQESKLLWETFLAIPVGGDRFRSTIPTHRLIIGYFHTRDGSQRKLLDLRVDFRVKGAASAHPTAIHCAHALCEIMQRVRTDPMHGDRDLKFINRPGLNTFRYWAIMLFTAYLFEVDRFQKRH